MRHAANLETRQHLRGHPRRPRPDFGSCDYGYSGVFV